VFSGCTKPQQIEVLTKPVTIDRPVKPTLPNPKSIDLEIGIKWKVLIKSRIPEKDDFVFYCVTPKDYEKMARNNGEILRWVKEAKWRLDYYRNEKGLDNEPKR
jgi:hypothetical protein